MRFVPAIIIATALLLVPVIWVGLDHLLAQDEYQGGAGIDSGARIEIERLRQQVESLNTRLDGLERELARVGTSGAMAPQPGTEDQGFRQSGPNDIVDAYAQLVFIADRRNVNSGMSVLTSSYLVEKLGRPREDLSDNCQSITNERLADQLVLEEVGPIRVKMLKPAAESLRTVFEKIRRADPDLYAKINTSGSLCTRLVRGSSTSISNHSYGMALDLNIDGHLDNLADGKTQLGLTILADFFRAEGWVWGAGFGREDSMHFEVSREMLDEWLEAGLL
ncbi:M15 family peptidase [Antarcticimicrobium luteum]|uniref:M15 family peptidase n=1 Tax=Antarcticimicrobium luteum TaxID=2547397 RepID=A0A4R5V4M5_9RHOB|nr:M15 family peptidase [Antarcticimicrobium luteum]